MSGRAITDRSSPPVQPCAGERSLAQIVAQKDADFNGFRIKIDRLSRGEGARARDRGADFAIRVLIQHHIDGARAQAGFGRLGEFMGNDADAAGPARGLECGDEAGIAGAQIVDAPEVGMLGKEAGGEGFGLAAIVMGFGRADQLDAGELGGDHFAKAGEAIGMVVQAERAGDQRHLARGHETPHQRGGGAAGSDIVDANEQFSCRIGQVGHQGHHGDAAAAERFDSQPHAIIVGGDDDGAVAGFPIERVQMRRQRAGIHGTNAGDVEMQPLGSADATAARHGFGQICHEFVTAIGQDELHPEVAGAGQERGGQVAAEVEFGDGQFDFFGRGRTHAWAAIDDPIDRGKRNARLASDIVHRGTPNRPVVVQLIPRGLNGAELKARSAAVNDFCSDERPDFAQRQNRAITPAGSSEGQRGTMSIAQRIFGDHQGRAVHHYTLTSETGVEVDLIDLGVVVRDWRVPVAGGRRSVVLGYDRLEDYLQHSPHFGAVAGRVANRIAGGRFEVDGKSYQTPTNENGHTLHGGPGGLGHTVWQSQPDAANNAVVFTHDSPDGHMGFPGNVQFKAVYTLKGNRLILELSALPDRKTPISLVQHQYFNLGGGPDVLDHSYAFKVSAYTQTDKDLIPTGAILPVEGTQYDLRTPRTLRDADGQPIKYDINLVIDRDRDPADPVAVVKSPSGDLTLKLWTDREGLQFYNAVYTNTAVPGLGGEPYRPHSGFCLEDQSFPDAVHHKHFAPIWHSPERPYAHRCEIEIG